MKMYRKAKQIMIEIANYVGITWAERGLWLFAALVLAWAWNGARAIAERRGRALARTWALVDRYIPGGRGDHDA